MRHFELHPISFAILVGALATVTLHRWPQACPAAAQAPPPNVTSGTNSNLVGAWGMAPLGVPLGTQGSVNLPISPSVTSLPLPSPESKEISLCDDEVHILLHSRDQIEVLRAGALVQVMNCSIGKRLP